MKDRSSEPLRGDAAWRATKETIAKRNDAARTRGAAERTVREAGYAEQRLATARREATSLPHQPRP